MVAVFLIPIAMMVVACLLERFESVAMSIAPPPRRSRADIRQPALPTASEMLDVDDQPARRLRLVPAVAEPVTPAGSTPTTSRPVDLDPDTLTLRRAS